MNHFADFWHHLTLHWHPDLKASGLSVLAILGLWGAGYRSISWDQQRKRDYRKKNRGW